MAADPSDPKGSTVDPRPPGQWYHAALDFQDHGEMPFFLFIPGGQSGEDAKLVNGQHEFPLPYVWDGDRVQLRAHWNYVSLIRAERTEDGGLQGDFVRDFPLWGEVVLGFRARPIDELDAKARFPGAADAEPVSVAGSWRFRFEQHGEGTGELFQEEGGVVRGFVRPGWLGDLGFLSGNVRGREIFLSAFNGNDVNLVRAELSEDGSRMTGLFSMYNVWDEKFTAERVEESTRGAGPRLVKGKKRLSEPRLEKYKGQPVVLFYFATWCSACNNSAPYFVELHGKYKDKVAFLSLAYDLSKDEEQNEAQLAAFRDKYGITWDAAQVPLTPEEWKDRMAPEIEGWDGFPVTVFIRRDGTVHQIYAGWYGPATGSKNEQVKAKFDQWLAEISES